MEKAIAVELLNHRYGEQQALKDLSFEVQHGEVFGLLGPNGAGKTTTVRLLNGLFEATSGNISVLGFDARREGEKIRSASGVLTETPALYERLTARQNLRFFGVLAGLSEREVGLRSMELLELFGLRERADERTGTYSKGMKQRLALARAWLNHPKLLFLDEPTSGLDPEAALQVRELIAGIRQQEGTTVLICTHNLDEAQRLCDRLLIMNAGRALALGSLTELRRLVSPGLWVEIAFHLPFPAHTGAVSAANIPGVLRSLSPTEHLLRLEVEAEQIIPQVITSLVQSGAQIVRVQPQEISLEEVYLKLQNSVHSLDGVQGGRHVELS